MQFENELMQQIKATAALLKLDEYVIEKDYFLTKAIGTIIDIQNPNYRLVFQGGTCLAKAHNIIDRISEDSDFRIQLINDKFASKEQEYKLLKEFRKSIITKLKNNNFVIHDEDFQVFNEGKSMSIRVAYPSTFAQIKHIKPYLAMDFFLGMLG